VTIHILNNQLHRYYQIIQKVLQLIVLCLHIQIINKLNCNIIFCFLAVILIITEISNNINRPNNINGNSHTSTNI